MLIATSRAGGVAPMAFRHQALLGTAFGALALWIATPANAQETPACDPANATCETEAAIVAPATTAAGIVDDGLAADDQDAAAAGEIVVVARRREERLVDVPIAITAFNMSDIAKMGAVDLSGLQGAIPNVNIVQGRGSTSNANIFIRGVGQPDALQTFDPAVGIYVDGVYLSRIQGALMNLADVQRVEVLRGPQGTLYGKNTIGGAVSIITRRPAMDAMQISGDVSYGNHNQWLVNGYASAPIVRDKVALSIASVYDHRRGIVKDPLTGKRYNDRKAVTMRALLAADVSDRFDLLLSGDYTHQKPTLTLGYPTAPLLATRFVPPGAVVLSPGYPYGPYDYKASTSFHDGEGQKLTHWGLGLTANWTLNDRITLSSISAYRRLKPRAFIDIDATQYELGDVFVGVSQKQWSQEFQLKYNHEKLAGVFGLYYLGENIGSHQEAYADDLFRLTQTLPISFTRFIDDKQKTRSYAAFGQASYDFTRKLSLTVGLRYTRETKRYHRITTTASSLAALNNLTFAFPDNLPAPLNSRPKAKFHAWTPMASLSFKPKDSSTIYASAARGFKSGGFNGRANSVADLTLIVDGKPTIVTRFKPEKAWTYELGAKGNFLDGRVRLAADVFLSDYKDFQARVGGGTVGSTGVFPVLNAGRLRMWGVETEGRVAPSKNFVVSVALGYLNAKYRKFADGRRVPPQAFSCNPTGQKVICKPAFAPPLTFRFGADYTLPLGGDFRMTFGGEERFVDKQYLSVDNRPGLFENGYFLTNAYVQLDWKRDFYLRGGVKNATKEKYKTDGQEFSSVGNIQTVYYGDPRQWTLTFGFKF